MKVDFTCARSWTLLYLNTRKEKKGKMEVTPAMDLENRSTDSPAFTGGSC